MPAEAAHEVVLNDGERGEHSCKENGAEQKNSFHELMITAPQSAGLLVFIQGSGLEFF